MPTDPRIHTLRLGEFQIPAALRSNRLLYYRAQTEEQREAAEACRDLVSHFRQVWGADQPTPETGRGIALLGPAGTGKTHLACATAVDVYYEHRVPIRFVYTPALIRDMTERFNLGTDIDAQQRRWQIEENIARVNDVPLLVLDDFGKEHKTSSGYAVDTLETLLRSRYTEGRPTIVTSNTPVSDWGKTYHESMPSFASEAFRLITVTGKDQRRCG